MRAVFGGLLTATAAACQSSNIYVKAPVLGIISIWPHVGVCSIFTLYKDGTSCFPERKTVQLGLSSEDISYDIFLHA